MKKYTKLCKNRDFFKRIERGNHLRIELRLIKRAKALRVRMGETKTHHHQTQYDSLEFHFFFPCVVILDPNAMIKRWTIKPATVRNVAM